MHKKLTQEIINSVEGEVILMLLNAGEQEEKKGKYIWNCNNSYYAEAFGVMRGLVTLGYCYFGASNTPETELNVRWWLAKLQEKTITAKKILGYEEALKLYNQKVSEAHEYNRKSIERAYYKSHK
jgi:hypothetical protein